MGNLWQKGQVLPVDIARDSREGKFYCTHGGSCVPSELNGNEAVGLIDCIVGPSIGDGDFQLQFRQKESQR